MVGHGESSAGSYLVDPTSPIPSHCASIVVTSTLRVNVEKWASEICTYESHGRILIVYVAPDAMLMYFILWCNAGLISVSLWQCWSIIQGCVMVAISNNGGLQYRQRYTVDYYYMVTMQPYRKQQLLLIIFSIVACEVDLDANICQLLLLSSLDRGISAQTSSSSSSYFSCVLMSIHTYPYKPLGKINS